MELPDDHLASHATVLPRRAGRRMLATWRDDVDACAALRCPSAKAASHTPKCRLSGSG